MEIPDWSTVLRRVRHWLAFVGVRRLVAGAASVIVACLVAWLLMRPSHPPVESVIPSVSGVSLPSPTMFESPVNVMVHVMGAVRNPGVFELSSTSRVVDAVRAAGGATGEADLERINLAQKIADTEQIFVPTRSQRKVRITVAPRHRSSTSTVSPSIPGATPTTTLVPAGNSGTASAKVNVNTASAEQLDTLPGIGPSIAKAIISYRTKSGNFKKVTDLMNVPGIGQAKFDAVRELVTV